ncbi:MAG: hypothetical protein HKN13_04815 [Rhodothermales bacterium]|nr:hypothetical protein [Rhodothermales bacterium]
MHRFIILFVTILLVAADQSSAQSISVGPQLSLVGLGGSASVQINELVSVSGEFGFVPIGEMNFDADDIEYSIDPKVAGGLIGVNLHPFGNNFSIGAGIFFGGYSGDASSELLTGEIEIGEGIYDGTDVGTLVGELKLNGVSPAITLGMRGKGFNVGIGIAFSGSPEFGLDATGALRTDPGFQSDLDSEIESAQEDVEAVPFIPIFRIGYQFGVSG